MQPPAASNRAVGRAALALLFVLTAYALWVAADALTWRMWLDTPLLHYMAFMVDAQDATPYRDIFVTSFPGSILFHLLILKTVGHGDTAFMSFNMLWLGALCVVSFGILRPFGWKAALGGGVLFAIAYFHQGATMMLQRDFALVLPIAAAVLVHVSSRGSSGARVFWIGFLFALAVTMKPHAGIGLPAVLFCEWLRNRERGDASIGRKLLLAAAGFAVPLVLVFGWLAASGGMPAFIEMMRDYLPMHLKLSRSHQYLEGKQRLYDYLTWSTQFGRTTNVNAGTGQPGWLVAATVGSLAVLVAGNLDSARQRLVLLLAVLSFLHWMYVLVSGQFWGYHWMPFRYTTALMCALCLADLPGLERDRIVAWHPLGSLVLAILMVMPISRETFMKLDGREPPAPDEGRVDEIASFLEERLEPGDTVQPMDWARGGIHAALEAKAHIATPFVSDYHFYHHVHEPYIQELRERFMRDMREDPPRFVLEMKDRPMPTGRYTTTEFPELSAMLESEYAPALEGPTWVVHERLP